MKVKRIANPCCGMTVGEVYEAKGDVNTYISVLLPSGEWTSLHWSPGSFELTETEEKEMSK